MRTRRGGSGWQVAVDRVHDLQRLAVTSVGAAALSELDVTVGRWRPPIPGWVGRPGLPGIVALTLEPTRSGVALRLTTSAPTDAALLLAAAVRCLRPTAPAGTGSMLTFTPGLPSSTAGLAGHVRDVLVPDQQRDAHVRRCDTIVIAEGTSPDAVEHESSLVVADEQWRRNGVPFEVCVDPTVHRPVGRRSVGPDGIAAATVTGTVTTLATTDGPVVIQGSLSAADVAALRGTRVVVGTHLATPVQAQLAACGIVTVAPEQALPAPDDHLAWQAWSVHERRHALRQHGPTAALDAWPTVSVVLVTHRPDHLVRAMAQVSRLAYPRLEVVVGVHGDRVDAAQVWQLAHDLPHPATVVALEGVLTLGEALQRCCDRAEGTLVTKMDDDDVYGPEHIWDLVLAHQYSGAQVVGKALDWIYLESQDATVFRPTYPAEKYADFVAGGTMLISRADLAAVGGWRPVPKSVDRALLDRVLADGGLVYRTHGLGYVYVRHSAGHTAAVRDEHFLTKTTATVPGLVAHACFGTDPGDDPR